MKSRVGRALPAARPLDFGPWTLDFSKKLLMSHGLSQNHEKPGGTGVLTCAFSRVPKKVLMVGGPSLRKLSQAVPDGPQAHPQSMTRPSVGRAKGRRLPHPPPQKNPGSTPTGSVSAPAPRPGPWPGSAPKNQKGPQALFGFLPRGSALHLTPYHAWRGRRDSNSRPPA
jgi:hypothetical protein